MTEQEKEQGSQSLGLGSRQPSPSTDRSLPVKCQCAQARQSWEGVWRSPTRVPSNPRLALDGIQNQWAGLCNVPGDRGPCQFLPWLRFCTATLFGKNVQKLKFIITKSRGQHFLKRSDYIMI